MLKLLLFLAASLNPAFSFSNEERGAFEADMFWVSTKEEVQITLDKLINQEPEQLERATSVFQPERGGKVSITTLRNGAGVATTAYIYRVVPRHEGDNGHICRIRIDPNGGPGLPRTMKWCLSFIDPAYRPTIKIPLTRP